MTDPDSTSATAPNYRRILLKLSGEALLGRMDYGIDPDMIARVAQEVAAVASSGVEVGIVIGGGNIFRGAGLASAGMDRITGDHMGMLATVMNALALQDALEQAGTTTRVMSAISVREVCEDYIRRRAVRHLEKGRVVVFAAGTGNPFFTTDTAASLRAIEIGADLMIKATKVDGVYSDDPARNSDARLYSRISYDEVIEHKLRVMDANAMVLCRDQAMPIRVIGLAQRGNLARLLSGEDIGTLIA